MTYPTAHPPPRRGDYILVYEYDPAFSIVCEYLWSEGGNIHGAPHKLYTVITKGGQAMIVVRYKRLDTHKHRGWKRSNHPLNMDKYRKYQAKKET